MSREPRSIVPSPSAEPEMDGMPRPVSAGPGASRAETPPRQDGASAKDRASDVDVRSAVRGVDAADVGSAESNGGDGTRPDVTSVLLWAFAGILVILWVPLLAVLFAFTVPFDRGRYTVGLWFRRAAVVFHALNPRWSFRTSGVRIRDPRRPYVVVANHESYADIFLISQLPWEMKWLSKVEIMKIPLMGWLMRMAGDIPVRRGSARSRAEALDGIRDRLDKRVSVIVLPEGTRSPTGELLPFRDGAFRIAVELGLPVLPLAVAGTRNAMAKGSFRFNRARAEVRVLDPIETAGMTLDDVPRLREEARSRIAEARTQILDEQRRE